jgi:hypothetical protein
MSSLLLTGTAAHRERVRGTRSGRRVVVPLAEYRAARAGHPAALRRGADPERPTGTGGPGAARGYVDVDPRAGASHPGAEPSGARSADPRADVSAGDPGADPDTCAAAAGPGQAPPLRLTRRGRVVVRLLGAAGLLLVVAVGVLGGRPAIAGQEAERVPVAERVVLPGETLWAIAGEVAPGTDRRETVAQIMELNGLESAEVGAGQRLSVPAGTP